MTDEDAKKLKNSLSGVLIVDKPAGMTSHDVISIMRRGTGIRRIGHTGTLDPRATGVLPVLVGPAVRLSEYLTCEKKAYEALIHFGTVSATYDGEGPLTETGAAIPQDETKILTAMEAFKGEIEQVPPAYSAIKINGRKAYSMARDGEEVQLTPRKITIHSLELIEYVPPEAVVDICCSAGTYIRSIANDLGNALGCGAYLSGLRRTISGNFSLADAVSLDTLTKAFEENNWFQYLIPAAEALPFQEIIPTPEQIEHIIHGRAIPADVCTGEMAKAVSEQGELLALLQYCPETSEWKPKKVFYQ